MRKFGGWLEAVHPDDRARADGGVDGGGGGKALAIEASCGCARATAATGISRPAGVPVLAEDGTIREWIGTNTDITARKEAETALREGQLRYQLATAAGGVGRLGPRPRHAATCTSIPSSRRSWATRITRSGTTSTTGCSGRHPEDLERVKADAAAYAGRARSADYEDEHRMVHKDGSIRWFLARGRLVAGPGERRRLVGTDTDVTARKLAAEALREVEGRHQAMLRAVPDMMFVLDKDGVYLDYHAPDPATLLVPPSQFLGRNVREFFPPELAVRIGTVPRGDHGVGRAPDPGVRRSPRRQGPPLGGARRAAATPTRC